MIFSLEYVFQTENSNLGKIFKNEEFPEDNFIEDFRPAPEEKISIWE